MGRGAEDRRRPLDAADARGLGAAGPLSPPSLPESASYVVVGGGVHGLSTAYHLAEALEARGRSGSEVVLLEKDRVGAGASGISGGIVRNFYLSPAMNELVRRSVEIFELDAAGFGFRAVGYVAAVPEEQADDLVRIAGQHELVGYPSRLVVGARACRDYLRGLFPDWHAAGVAAVLHEPRAGWADARRTVANLAGMARSLGVRIVEGAEVLDARIADRVVTALETPLGSIACESVVIAPGPWVRELWTMLGLPRELGVDGGQRPFFTYLQVREGDFALRSGAERLPERAPVVHLDARGPLRSDRDGRVLHEGAWGIYFRPSAAAEIQGGGLPAALDPDCELDPYGPSHPRHGTLGDAFDEWFTSGLATALGRFRGRADEWRSSSYGAQVAFTPDSYPVVDHVLPNAYAVVDSSHGFKLLALGRLAAAELLDGRVTELEPFRLSRFAAAQVHPVSASPYPWT